jgi:hypothetical protein
VTTAAELDPAPKLGAYAHPERLVTTAWLAEHLDDPNLVVAESDEDVLLYETGHIPGAVKIDWHLDLNDPVERDYVSGDGFARLMSSKGISRPPTRSGSAPSSATRTSACWTAAARSGWRRAARSPPRCPSASPPTTR